MQNQTECNICLFICLINVAGPLAAGPTVKPPDGQTDPGSWGSSLSPGSTIKCCLFYYAVVTEAGKNLARDVKGADGQSAEAACQSAVSGAMLDPVPSAFLGLPLVTAALSFFFFSLGSINFNLFFFIPNVLSVLLPLSEIQGEFVVIIAQQNAVEAHLLHKKKKPFLHRENFEMQQQKHYLGNIADVLTSGITDEH